MNNDTARPTRYLLAARVPAVGRGFARIFWASVLVCMAVGRSPANEFVGVLSLALEDDVARQVGLSESTLSRLRDLVDERESAAIELAYEVRDLPDAEQAARLTPFRTQSEELGLALLTAQQRDDLEAIRIARLGMSSLAEATSRRPASPDSNALTSPRIIVLRSWRP